jgi:hypothetical protein
MRIITTLFFIANFFVGYSQIDTTTVPFVSYWAKGDSYNFEVTKVEQEWKMGNKVRNDTSSYVVNFTVLDSTANDYTIKWSYINELKKFGIPSNLRERFSKYENIDVIYKTTELGEFVEIVNWKEISDTMKDMFAVIVDVLSETKTIDRETLEQSMAPLLKVYESKEGIEQLVFKELYFFHFPFGVEFSATEPIEYEEFLPNLFGGDPIRGETKVFFDTINFEEDYCVMRKQMNISPEDTKELLSTLFKQMGLDEEEFTKELEKSTMRIEDDHRFEYYYYPGIPISIHTNRKLEIKIKGEELKKLEQIFVEWID